MKKLALALVCLVSVAFFASCNPNVDDPKPTISVIMDEGYVTDGAVVDLNTPLLYGFVVASNAETQKELSNLKVYIDDVEWANVDLTGLTSYVFADTVTFTLDREDIVGESVIKGIVTDIAGETNTATITVSLKSEPLVANDFTWNRHGGVAATGLDEFGLEWTSNAKEIYAVITPLEGATLYKFDPEVWEATTTNSQKAALFGETAISIDQFKEVSCTAVDKDYDIVIGTAYKGEYHLIHVTHSHVFTFKGTDVTITGQAK